LNLETSVYTKFKNMPWLEDISYDRDETINAIRDYYKFLTDMYMDESLIKEAPDGGWPNMNQEVLGPLCKTDEVIDLLAHLPYIDEPEWDTAPHGTAYVRFLDWATEASRIATGREEPDDWVEGIRLSTELSSCAEEEMPVPDSIVGLLEESERRIEG
jgi:hypothetical protein